MKLTLLDASQLFTMRRFLACPKNAEGKTEVEYDLWLWATGRAPYPNLTVITWPG